MKESNSTCKPFLMILRKKYGVPKDDKIDKRYKPYLAPNDRYYESHCGYCAEVDYIIEKYSDGETI